MTAFEIRSKRNKPGILLVRAAWWLITGVSIILFLAAIPIFYPELQQVCTNSPCLAMQLNLGRAIALVHTGLDFELYAVLIIMIQILVYCINLSIGVFIFSHKSHNWLVVLISLMLITSIQADLFRVILTAYPAFRLPVTFLGIINSVLLVIFFYIFPTGSFNPRWTAGLAGIWILLIVANSAFPILTIIAPAQSSLLLLLVLIALIFSSGFVLIHRYRNIFNPVQRDQSKWVIFGVIITWGGEVLLELLRSALPVFQTNAVMFISLNIFELLWTLVLPVSILLAVLSSALLDIDVLIRRTLAYSLLTITLLAVYIVIVLALQKIFVLATGQRSAIVSIVSTLVIAAMFTPMRQRMQLYIDRVFFRNTYNAEQAIQTFNASVREDVDLEEISAQFVGIVRSTLQPEYLSLWLCKISTSKDYHSKDQIR